MGIPEKDPLSQLSLPPGFRFYPTDEELLVQYLCRKVAGHNFTLPIIAEIDLYKFDPWVLPSKAIFGEKEWYFFSPRDRKYPNGSRPNRVAGSGYWKATGTDKIITTEGRKVGIKKALVFYVGKAPKGTKTNWIMHEYRLLDSSQKNTGSRLDDWVLCRIYKKNSSAQRAASNGTVSSREYTQYSNGSSSSSSSHLDDVMESLPEIGGFTRPRVGGAMQQQREERERLNNNLQSGGGGGLGLVDWSNINNPSVLNSLAAAGFVPVNQEAQQGQNQGMMNFGGGGGGGYNDLYVPSLPNLCQVESSEKMGKPVEEEVQSGVRTQQVENPGFFAGSNGFTQGFSNSVDQYGFRYPAQTVGFGFGK